MVKATPVLHVGGLYSSVGQSARLVSARSGVRTSLEATFWMIQISRIWAGPSHVDSGCPSRKSMSCQYLCRGRRQARLRLSSSHGHEPRRLGLPLCRSEKGSNEPYYLEFGGALKCIFLPKRNSLSIFPAFRGPSARTESESDLSRTQNLKQAAEASKLLIPYICWAS